MLNPVLGVDLPANGRKIALRVDLPVVDEEDNLLGHMGEVPQDPCAVTAVKTPKRCVHDHRAPHDRQAVQRTKQ